MSDRKGRKFKELKEIRKVHQFKLSREDELEIAHDLLQFSLECQFNANRSINRRTNGSYLLSNQTQR